MRVDLRCSVEELKQPSCQSLNSIKSFKIKWLECGDEKWLLQFAMVAFQGDAICTVEGALGP
jgi:hypothetical protein